MAPAVHENDRPRALHGCEWHEALNAHAMNPVLRLIHANLALLMSTDIEIMSGDDTKTLVGMIHPDFPHADDVLRIQPLLRADLGEEQRLSGKVF
jgi:hypothetical protein